MFLVLLVAGVLSTTVGGASAAGWLPPDSVPLAATDVGFDALGNAVAVGIGGDPASVRATDRTPGSSWSASVVLSGSDSNVRAPRVAVDPVGNAVAVWAANDAVRIATRPVGGAWNAPVTLSDGSVMPGNEYAVVIDKHGRATVAWIEFAGSGFVVRSTSAPFNGNWNVAADAAVTLSDDNDGNATSLRLAGAPNGNATALWIVRKALVASLQSKRRASDLWSPSTATIESGLIIEEPQVAVDAQGDATAVWTAAGDVHSARRVGAGSWSNPAADFGGGREPQVAVDVQGNATAVWTAGMNGATTVNTRTRTAGTNSWSAREPLATSSAAGDVSSPRVAADPQGAVTAIWARGLASNATAQASRRELGGSWSPPSNLAAGSLNINAPPVGGLDPQGHATLLWSKSSSPSSGFSSVFDPVAPDLRNLVVPAYEVFGLPVDMSVDPFDAWSAVTTMWDFGDGRSASGTAVRHTYSTPGRHAVTVTAVDAAGNTTRATRTITIAPPLVGDPGPGSEDPGPGNGPGTLHRPPPLFPRRPAAPTVQLRDGKLSLRGLTLKRAKHATACPKTARATIRARVGHRTVTTVKTVRVKRAKKACQTTATIRLKKQAVRAKKVTLTVTGKGLKTSKRTVRARTTLSLSTGRLRVDQLGLRSADANGCPAHATLTVTGATKATKKVEITKRNIPVKLAPVANCTTTTSVKLTGKLRKARKVTVRVTGKGLKTTKRTAKHTGKAR